LAGRRGKRQPIDRIDEPSEWRDRLRMQSPRLLIERHPLERFSLPVIYSSGRLRRFERALPDGLMDPVDRPNKRQPMDRIDQPSLWRDRHIPKLKELLSMKRRT